MDPRAMAPFGAALAAYAAGDETVEILMHRDDGFTVALPVRHFFRPREEWGRLEELALERCQGRVLDCGAGTGRHTLVLEERGHAVTALDVCEEAVALMRTRGVRDARCADVFAFEGGPFDTLLLLGHGIGMAETLDGLDALLARLPRLVAPGGQVLLDTVDVRETSEPAHLAYHERNRQAGRYAGEIGMALEYRGARGPLYRWLHLDPDTLAAHAAAAGWACEVLGAEPGGELLARLTRAQGPGPG